MILTTWLCSSARTDGARRPSARKQSNCCPRRMFIPFLNDEARRPAGRPFTRTHERVIPPARRGDGGQSPYRFRNVCRARSGQAVTIQAGDTRGCTMTDGHVSTIRNAGTMYYAHTHRAAAVDTRCRLRDRCTSPAAPPDGARCRSRISRRVLRAHKKKTHEIKRCLQ